MRYLKKNPGAKNQEFTELFKMAAYQIPPPSPMNCRGDVSTNWKTFRKSWEYYCQATELEEKSEAVKVGALCSVMWTECRNIMLHLSTLNDDERQNSATILNKLEHFRPQKHFLFERFKFNSANQTESETVDQYVIRLRQLAESCEYEALKEGLIRDRLVMGTNDISTRDRLLKERPVPDLNKCVDFLRATELSKAHRGQLRGIEEKTENVHATRQFKQKHKAQNNSVNDCKYCGKGHPRDKEKCPAYGKTCKKCGKSNHLATVCKASDKKSGDKKWHRKKKVHQSETQYESNSEESLYACYRISAVNGSHKSKFMMKNEVPNQ